MAIINILDIEVSPLETELKRADIFCIVLPHHTHYT